MKNNNFVKYKDLLTINKFNEETNNEKFVYLPLKDNLVIGIYQADKNMLDYGQRIAVRYTVYEKLKNQYYEKRKKIKKVGF